MDIIKKRNYSLLDEAKYLQTLNERNNMNANDNLTGKAILFACGGCGINIAHHFETFRNQTYPGFAELDVVYLDTSKANLGRNVDPDKIYLVDGLDGSGKVRAENHREIGECVLDILQTHKPGDINFVLSSGSGGSGSVIAPSLVQELLQRNIPVIVITVGSTDSLIELENTIKTLKSYEAIAQMRKVPVNALYYENSKSMVRSEVDKHVQTSIVLLAALFSKQNKELDSSDLYNWLSYSKVTSYQPHLSYIEFYPKEIKVEKPVTVISVATLTTDGDDTNTGTKVEYQCVGYINKEVMTKMELVNTMHIAILDGVFSEIHKRLSKTLTEFDEEKKARISKSSILSDSDRPTTTGLVL